MVWAAGWPAQALILSYLRAAKMVKCKKSAPKKLTMGDCLRLPKHCFHHLYSSVKRIVPDHFWHVHFVIWELGRPRFPAEAQSSILEHLGSELPDLTKLLIPVLYDFYVCL